MKYLSICSGIEAASVAWHELGWSPIGFSEIEPFPCAVLKHHFPTVPNFGDMTKYHEWPDLSVDVLVGGTPCQAFSVAGFRKGLADPRGNLTLTFLGIVDRYRPRWVVWENVPGVLSEKSGAFGALLGGLGELGYGWAYRILGAQYFGVAQRRRRVFVVGHLGDWQRAAAVLFEPESLRWDSTPSRVAGEGPAPTVRAGAANGGTGPGARSGDSKDELIVPVTVGTLDTGRTGRTGRTGGESGAGGIGGMIPQVVGALTDGAHNGGGLTGKTPTPDASPLPSVAWALQERDAKGSDSSTKEGHLIPCTTKSRTA